MYPSAPNSISLPTRLTCKVVCYRYNGHEAKVEIRENDEPALSEQTVLSLIGLGQILRKIRARLVSEGVAISERQEK